MLKKIIFSIVAVAFCTLVLQVAELPKTQTVQSVATRGEPDPRLPAESEVVGLWLDGKTLRWLDSTQCKWLAWAAEYPKTDVYQQKKVKTDGRAGDAAQLGEGGARS